MIGVFFKKSMKNLFRNSMKKVTKVTFSIFFIVNEGCRILKTMENLSDVNWLDEGSSASPEDSSSLLLEIRTCRF